MPLTFQKYFEEYTSYHSFTDLLNLTKEVSDYVYNNDITKSQLFDEFKETDDGYVILFNRSGKKNYFIDLKKKKVFDDNKDEQLIDSVYEDIENLYNIIKNYEFMVNIKQIDEKIKTFDEIVEKLDSTDYDYDNIIQMLKSQHGWGDLSGQYFEDFENSEYFNDPITDGEYADQMHKWLYANQTGADDSVYESFEGDYKSKLSHKYTSLKRGILDILDKTLNSDATKLQGFMEDYIDPESNEILEGFVEDADIFDFYLKYQADIDQILKDREYYNDPPEVESLYDYVIDGTFDAVVYCMEDMKKELFDND
jgi:hypothetical protein